MFKLYRCKELETPCFVFANCNVMLRHELTNINNSRRIEGEYHQQICLLLKWSQIKAFTTTPRKRLI